MKGIVLAGGAGTRLWPITKGISKQLLPVYDKPMIFYPLGTLMLAGIRDIAIVTTQEDQSNFKKLLGDGSQWGISLSFFVQPKPEGIAQAFVICRDFIGEDPVALILGDNIFNGSGIGRNLQEFASLDGARIFAYQVNNPSEFGVVLLDENDSPTKIIEKPKNFISDLAIPGLYFYGNDVCEKVLQVQKSSRGELEISSLNEIYLAEKRLKVTKLPRGTVWLDGGTLDGLNDASNYVRVMEQRQGLKLCCIEEIAYKNEWISSVELLKLAEPLVNSGYGLYLRKLVLQSVNKNYT
jgi:glucose-1-phosphate thymidylyltransferase